MLLEPVSSITIVSSLLSQVVHFTHSMTGVGLDPGSIIHSRATLRPSSTSTVMTILTALDIVSNSTKSERKKFSQ